jgi:release factor glutamine methyltransferase
VGFHEADKVQDVVKKFEPKMAVFAGENGLDIIRRLIPQAYEALRAGGYLVFEIGYTMAPMATELLSGWNEVRAVPDLSGIPRVMVAKRP